jgi:hypothetical protein
VRRSLAIRAGCGREACRVRASGLIRVPRVGATPARVMRVGPVTRQVAANRRTTLELAVSSSARRAILRALRAGRRVSAAVTVTATGAENRTATKRRSVRLRR